MCVAEYQKIIYSEQLLFVFGVSVSAVERHKARTVDIERVFLNGIMTYEICTEISGQCLNDMMIYFQRKYII